MLDSDTGAEVAPPLSGPTGPVHVVAYSADGTRIVSGGDNTIHVWAADPDQSIGKRLPGFTFDGSRSLPAAVGPDGRVAATRDVNNQSDIALWRIDTGKLVRTISTGYQGAVSALAWRPDGNAIAAADGRANTVRIWNAQTGEPEGPPLTGPSKGIHALSFSPDGNRLAALVLDSASWLWDISPGPPHGMALRGEGGYVNAAGFSADGRRLITVQLALLASDADKARETGNFFDTPKVTPSGSGSGTPTPTPESLPARPSSAEVAIRSISGISTPTCPSSPPRSALTGNAFWSARLKGYCCTMWPPRSRSAKRGSTRPVAPTLLWASHSAPTAPLSLPSTFWHQRCSFVTRRPAGRSATP